MKKLLISLMVAFCALTSVNFNIDAQDFKSSNLIYDDVNSSQWFYKHQGRKPTTLEWWDECRLID